MHRLRNSVMFSNFSMLMSYACYMCIGCATNCKSCDTQGKDKCDNNMCFDGYANDALNNACESRIMLCALWVNYELTEDLGVALRIIIIKLSQRKLKPVGI